jgi:hypothetical protein
MNEGVLLEYRLSRLFFYNDYFSRRSLPLKNYFYPDSVDITDIDVLGIKYDIDFSKKKIFADCKSNIISSNKDAKPANRILWSSGLKNFLKCDYAYFCKPRIGERMKDFALKNDILPIDYIKLEELEKRFNISDKWEGSYNKSKYSDLLSYYKDIKKNKRLNKLYWFLRLEFWTLPSHFQIKKCINHLYDCFKERNITSNYKKYLLCELYCLSSIAIINLCSDTYPYTKSERERWITTKMTEGIGTIEQQEKLLKTIKAYTQAKVEELTHQKTIIDFDDFKISPPPYTKNLIELIERFVDKPLYSINVPRFMDYFLYQYILYNKKPNRNNLEEIFSTDIDMLAKLSKNIIRFVDPIGDERKINSKILNF